MTRTRSTRSVKPKLVALAAVLGLVLSSAGAATGHPSQHGPTDGHLVGTGAFGNIEFVGKLVHDALKPAVVADLVADVAVSPDGKWAFLANWGRATCAANSEKGGVNNPDAGAWVIDISDPANPKQVGFIPHHQDSRPGEGMEVVALDTKFFKGWVLVMNNEQCGKNGKGGVSLFDVTNPRKPFKLSEHFGDFNHPDSNDIHSSFAWQAGDRAFVVIVDNFETMDVDILDITNPKRPRLIKELNLNTFVTGGIDQPEFGLSQSFLHDMVVKEIGGRFILLLSYWDGGFVKLDVTNPANPIFIGHTEYTSPDPLLLERLGVSAFPEGNGHQAEFTKDNKFIIGTDEDFSPFGVEFRITTGPNAGQHPGGEFGWTVPIVNLPDGVLNGPTVYGGYGCPLGDASSIPDPSVLGPLAADEEAILVLQRGPVGDPSANFDACFFSEKVEQAQLKGYDAVIIPNHHVGAQGGEAPDAFLCGGQGHVFTPTIPGVCISHRALHLLFNTTPAYNVPYVSGTEPPIGTLGGRVTATSSFNGWGYVHLFDANTMAELDTYAIAEAHDPAFASGFGDLTVHEVATDPQDPMRAYLSYYAGGLRSLEIQCSNLADTSTCRLVEVGSYLDPNGNDFWGVEAFVRDGQTYILGSDRDSGLWIFRRKP